MKYKKLITILILFISFFVVGCKKNNTISLYDGVGKLSCSREGSLDGGSVSFNYDIDYKNGYITRLHSTEKVTSEDNSILDTYEEAYKNIFANYKGLKYYDNNITREENTVICDTVINYQKIDIDKLLEIEGSEDNVIEDGKVKVITWKSFAEKFGTTCQKS